MYTINGMWTFAIDVETGRQIWRTPVELEPGSTRAAINRGAPALYNGKLFRVTLDNHLVALDMKTGKIVWSRQVTAEDIYEAWRSLRTHDVVLGPATDGGYWLVGLRRPQPQLFHDIPWSTERSSSKR